MKSPNKDIIYQGNTVISIEKLPDYPHPVIIKKPSKKHTFPHHIQSLGKEYEMIRALGKVKGIRKALDQKSIENQPALILEYIDGETLRDYIARKTLNLRSRLEIAADLARVRRYRLLHRFSRHQPRHHRPQAGGGENFV